jgi:hypothetical protein
MSFNISGKKRRNQRFTPYGLSNSEYEKIECEKIQRNREKMVKQGKTLAPFNTTQFIMDEHRDEIQQTIDCKLKVSKYKN